MAVSPPCTAIPNMEMSLSLSSGKSEQDPAASSVGDQPPCCSLSRKYMDSPAVPKLTLFHLLPAATPPPGCGSPHAYAIMGEEAI